MKWKVQTAQLLKEIVEHNPTAWTLRVPVIIFRSILVSVAERAIAIDDPELNILMLRLGLYEVHPLEVEAAITIQKARLPHEPHRQHPIPLQLAPQAHPPGRSD